MLTSKQYDARSGCVQDVVTEQSRQRELESFHILDTPPEREFDDFTTLAAQISSTPIALISFLDPERQWFKSRRGIEASETPRAWAFCNYALTSRSLFEVTDARLDPRFVDNPLVTGEPFIRFYAGAPLTTSAGDVIGTLCVIDREPRQLTEDQKSALLMLGRQVVARLELRRANAMLQVQIAFQEAIVASAGAGIIATNPDGIISHFNPQAEQMLGYSAHEMIGHQTPAVFHDPEEMVARARDLSQELGRVVDPGFEAFVAKARSTDGFVDTREWTYVRKDGSRFPVLLSVSALRERGGRPIGYLGIARDITEGKKLESDLIAQAATIKRQKDLLSELRVAQDLFIQNQSGKECFDHLLVTLLRYTDSARGVLADVRYGPTGDALLKTQACIAISPTTGSISSEVVGQGSPAGCSELSKAMESVLTSKVVFVGQIPARIDSVANSGPRSVIAIPIYNDRELVGVVGLAERGGGYSRELLDEIQPLVSTYANLILARRNFFSRNIAEQKVKDQDVLLSQKQILLQEIHHRVKNNLQIISSLLRLQLAQTKTPEVAEQLRTARARISAVAMLHEVLYRSDSMECVDLARFLGELRNRIKETFGSAVSHVALDVEAPPAIGLSHDQAGPLALIVNELATNSLKHAFDGRNEGHISIKASVVPYGHNERTRDLRVEVQDDGTGYVGGRKAAEEGGLGSKIADRLTAQLGGRLVRQPIARGTRWELTIPLNQHGAH